MAYAHIAANAVINTLANHDNSDEVGGINNADLIDEDLQETNHHVTMAVAHWFRGADNHQQLNKVVHDVSTVNDHPSGFHCTWNTSERVSWFRCARGDHDRQAPCFNCPAVQRLGTLVCRTDLDESIDTILSLSQGQRHEPDLEWLGPLPAPEGPAAHCLQAIRHLPNWRAGLTSARPTTAPSPTRPWPPTTSSETPLPSRLRRYRRRHTQHLGRGR